MALEKILKAHWVKNNEQNFPPKTHNLTFIYVNATLDLNEEQTTFLQMMNIFQIEGRYPDYLSMLHNTTTKENTEKIINEAKQLFICLQNKMH